MDFLKQGDWIGVTAPSDGYCDEIDYRRLDSAKEQFEARGFRIKETNNVRTSVKGRSSSARERAEQFMELIMDDEVKMILCARGGDYLAECLPYLEFEEIKKHPKWIQGYSDPTGILFSVATKCFVPTVYGSNYGDFGMRPWATCLERNFEVLCGTRSKQESFAMYQNGFLHRETGYESFREDEPVATHALNGEDTLSMSGRLLGGCLDVLLNLIGTPYENVKGFIEQYKEEGILWYLESFALNSETLTVALWQLKEAGWFAHAKGIIFGRPCFFESGTDTSFDEAVKNALEELKLPILTEADIGHKPPYLTMINGAYAKVAFQNGKIEMEQMV